MAHGVELTNGRGETIDLADPSTKVVRVPAGELGSAYPGYFSPYGYPGERLFGFFEQGKVFETRDLSELNFEEMLRRDGKAKTIEAVLTLPLRAAEWSLEPAANDNGEVEFVREALMKPANAGGMTTPMELVIGQMTSACLFRRAYFEKVFQVDGSRVTYAKLAFRPARTCYMLRNAQDFSFAGFKQRFLRGAGMEEVVIPPQKSFVYIHGTHREPLNGTSDLETPFAIYETKQKIRFLWYSFLENQTIPKAIAKDSKPDPESQRQFADKVASLKGGGVVGIGPDQDVSAFESTGRGADVFAAAMDYLSREQVGSILAGFTELMTGGKGSYALSKDQSDFFLMSRLAVLSEMAAAITSWVVADLCLWNFGTQAAVPTFKFKQPAQGMIEKSIDLLQALATATVQTAVPHEFIDLLIEKVSGYLEIDTATVHEAITKRQEAAPQTPVGQLQAGINAAAQLVAQAGVTGGNANPAAPAPAA